MSDECELEKFRMPKEQRREPRPPRVAPVPPSPITQRKETTCSPRLILFRFFKRTRSPQDHQENESVDAATPRSLLPSSTDAPQYHAPSPMLFALLPRRNKKQVPQFVPLGCDPVQLVCFNCKAEVRTVTKGSANAVCLFCCLPCTICFNECQDVEHRCPNCNAFLGIFKPT